jgi:hypothetical protein
MRSNALFFEKKHHFLLFSKQKLNPKDIMKIPITPLPTDVINFMPIPINVKCVTALYFEWNI